MRICEQHPKRGARKQWRKSSAREIRHDKTDNEGVRITTNVIRRYFDRFNSPPAR